MKIAFPLATIVLFGVAVCLHRSATPTEPGRSPMRVPDPVEQEVDSLKAERCSETVDLPKRESAVVLKRPEAVSKGIAPATPWQNLKGVLDRGLGLTLVQKAAVEEILRDRESDIRDCHEAIRKAGVLDMRHYEWQVGLMKAGWYGKIDALLDVAQHERFVEMVERGLFNEGLAFTHQPGMTVLD